MKILFVAIFLMLTACGSMTPKPEPTPEPPLGPEECGPIPGTKARYCRWKTCPVESGTLAYMPGLLEDERAPVAKGSILVPAHSEFKAMAKDQCKGLLTLSWSTPGLGGLPTGWMIRPPGTIAATPPSPSWDETDKAITWLMLNSKITRPFFLYGQSMGGFNASTIANLKENLVDGGLILTHPVMGPFPNFSPCPSGQMICNTYQLLVAQNFYVQEWKIANPIETIKTVKKMPRMYVAACPSDEFGLWEGPKAYAQTAKERGFDVTFNQEPSGCKHTTLDMKPLLEWMKK